MVRGEFKGTQRTAQKILTANKCVSVSMQGTYHFTFSKSHWSLAFLKAIR